MGGGARPTMLFRRCSFDDSRALLRRLAISTIRHLAIVVNNLFWITTIHHAILQIASSGCLGVDVCRRLGRCLRAITAAARIVEQSSSRAVEQSSSRAVEQSSSRAVRRPPMADASKAEQIQRDDEDLIWVRD